MLVFCFSAWRSPFEQVIRNYFVAYLATSILFTAWLFYRRRWTPHIPAWRTILDVTGSLRNRSAEFFVLNSCSTVAMILGTFVSGAISGLAAAGDFSLIQRIFSLFITLHLAFLSPVSPFITRVAQAGDWASVQAELRKCLWRIWPLVFPLAGGLMFVSHPLVLRLWTGRWITDYTVAGCLFAWVSIMGFNNTFSIILNSLGLVRMQAAFGICMILPSVYLPVYLGKWLGVPGIALATALAAVPGLFIYPAYTTRAIREQRIRV
jgi:O-antigen/teichoic acid export membrane protein